MNPVFFSEDDLRVWASKLAGVTHSVLDEPYFALAFVSFVAHLFGNLATHILFSAFSPGYRRAAHKVEFCTRVVSNVHAFISTYLTFYVFVTEPAVIWDSMLVPSYTARVAVAVSIGYFLNDLIMITVFHKHIAGVGPTMVHHLVGMTAFCVTLTMKCAECVPLLFLFTEASTPFVNLRWFILEYGHKDTLAYSLSAVLMLLAFFVVRIVTMPWMVYQAVTTMPPLVATCGWVPTVALTIGISAAVVLNTMWFMMMVRAARRALSGKPIDDDASGARTTKGKGKDKTKAE